MSEKQDVVTHAEDDIAFEASDVLNSFRPERVLFRPCGVNLRA
jgi:hypothetical protein